MNLVICGNGFDLNHGLKTGYKDYKEFLYKNYPDSFRHFENFEYINLTGTDLWSNLESSLTIDAEELFSNSLSDFYPDMNDDSDSRWHNFDIDIQTQTKFIYDFTGRYFYEWLDGVRVESVTKRHNLKQEDLYITFNYTNILGKTYKIPKENILHIHGSVEKISELNQNLTDNNPKLLKGYDNTNISSEVIREEIQFGSVDNNIIEIEKSIEHEYGQDEFYSATIEPGLFSLLNFCEAASKDMRSNHKKLERFIRQREIKKVIIMGHSIMKVDKPYYKDIIIPLLMESCWYFYYYNDSVKLECQQFVEEFGIKKYEYVKW